MIIKPKPKEVKLNSLLIDGENLLKIGFHGTKNVQTEDGKVGTIFYFINTIKKFYVDFGITKVVVFWEGENSTQYREGYYPYYKKNRDGKYTEDELYDLGRQRIRIKQYLEELYIRQVEVSGCEADDGIAFYVKNAPNENILILSADRDLLQLIGENVKQYLLDKKVIITDQNFKSFFNYHRGNVGLIKMIAGDSSDNISGLQGIGDGTALKLFPELREEIKNYSWILERSAELLAENPKTKALETILEGKTKWGLYGKDYFAVMEKVISLEAPNVTEELKETIHLMVNEPLDPTGRGGIDRVMKMIHEDKLINYIPSYDDQYFVFWSTFITIIKKEQNLYKTKK